MEIHIRKQFLKVRHPIELNSTYINFISYVHWAESLLEQRTPFLKLFFSPSLITRRLKLITTKPYGEIRSAWRACSKLNLRILVIFNFIKNMRYYVKLLYAHLLWSTQIKVRHFSDKFQPLNVLKKYALFLSMRKIVCMLQKLKEVKSTYPRPAFLF